MTSKDVWKTRRQKIIDLLKQEREINNLHDLYKEMKDGFMKIPSKCPKCKKEKILWPSLKIK
ncbi:MAG: hypothetical protein ACTSRP_15005 [Candidatus Helarchaeota archaeon]